MRRFTRKILEILDGTPAEYGQRREGQSLVEMAFIIPILLLLVAGLVEVGWYTQNYLNVLEAAKVGARRGPFMQIENSPLNWVEASGAWGAASLAPIPALGFDPTSTNALNSRRYTSRGLSPAGCAAIPGDELGFYNIIACTVRQSLDPLQIRTNGADDIVISVFALQNIKIGTEINPAVRGPATTYANRPQVVVVGRYPIPANECNYTGMDTSLIPRERDPFDWIDNGSVDWEFVPNPLGGPNIRMIYELGYYDEVTGEVVGYIDTADERQRGWALLGQHRIRGADGDDTGCFGSDWSTLQVQEMLNMNNFFQNDEERNYLPSQGIVLVEVFWQHALLFEDLPVFSSTYSPFSWALGFGSGDPNAGVIRAWAAFTAPSAEPNINFDPLSSS
jgi:hypothetical protein